MKKQTKMGPPHTAPVDALQIRAQPSCVIPRLLLLIAVAIGLAAARILPGESCATRACDCCHGATSCCTAGEDPDPQSPATPAPTPELKLALARVPSILAPRPAAPSRLTTFSPGKPPRLPSLARIELTCVRLI